MNKAYTFTEIETRTVSVRKVRVTVPVDKLLDLFRGYLIDQHPAFVDLDKEVVIGFTKSSAYDDDPTEVTFTVVAGVNP